MICKDGWKIFVLAREIRMVGRSSMCMLLIFIKNCTERKNFSLIPFLAEPQSSPSFSCGPFSLVFLRGKATLCVRIKFPSSRRRESKNRSALQLQMSYTLIPCVLWYKGVVGRGQGKKARTFCI